MNFNGKWEGFYEYGFGYTVPYFGKRVEIEAEISLNDSNNITGFINEVQSDFSVPKKSTIRGFIEKDLVSFIKTYNVIPTINSDNKLEILEGKMNIDHVGYIDESNNSIYGEWQINQRVEEEDILLTGIWLLEKS